MVITVVPTNKFGRRLCCFFGEILLYQSDVTVCIAKALVSDKLSMLTGTYPHKPLRKIKVAICKHQASTPLYVWRDDWSGNLQAYKKMVMHDTECPYWDQVLQSNKKKTLKTETVLP